MKLVILTFAGIMLMATAMLLGEVAGSSYRCSSQWGDRGEFRVGAGCMVRIGDEFVPEKTIRVTP